MGPWVAGLGPGKAEKGEPQCEAPGWGVHTRFLSEAELWDAILSQACEMPLRPATGSGQHGFWA